MWKPTLDGEILFQPRNVINMRNVVTDVKKDLNEEVMELAKTSAMNITRVDDLTGATGNSIPFTDNPVP